MAGAEDFYALSKALKAAGRTGKGSLRNELHAELRKAMKPLAKVGQKALSDAAPAGVAQRGLRTKHVVQVKTGSDPAITLGIRYGKRGTGLGASNVRRLNNQGIIRHPVFADTAKVRKQWTWVNQPVPGAQGSWDDAVRRAAPRIVRPRLDAAVERVLDKVIARG